ncbi:MAG: DUF2922 domain-containing protein [Synergistaceae bacterium]|nr:DUF2922 domain-containing protein [Synergistaceae bacterium]
MATSLKLTFKASGDKDISLTFPYANGSASSAQVKSLMQGIVANGDIYVEPPLGLVDAEFVNRIVTPVDLS